MTCPTGSGYCTEGPVSVRKGPSDTALIMMITTRRGPCPGKGRRPSGLVMLVIVMDVNGIAVAGITAEKIYEVISADYEEVLETWVEAISSNVRK